MRIEFRTVKMLCYFVSHSHFTFFIFNPGLFCIFTPPPIETHFYPDIKHAFWGKQMFFLGGGKGINDFLGEIF